MRKKMKIGPRVAIITSAMILAGSMAACGNTKDTDNKITTATVTDASVMDGAENTSEDAADTEKKDSAEEKTTTEGKDSKATTEQEASGKADTTEKPSNSKPSTTESKPATTQAPSSNKPSTTESKPSTTESKPTTTQAPSTTQATTEAAKDHSWVYSWKEKKENVKIADEWSYPEYAAARHCRDCGQDSLASTWNGQTCPLCGGTSNYGSAPDMPTGNMITEPAIYQEQVVGYTCTIKCSRCGETRTFECDANKNGNINTSGKCK